MPKILKKKLASKIYFISAIKLKTLKKELALKIYFILAKITEN